MFLDILKRGLKIMLVTLNGVFKILTAGRERRSRRWWRSDRAREATGVLPKWQAFWPLARIAPRASLALREGRPPGCRPWTHRGLLRGSEPPRDAPVAILLRSRAPRRARSQGRSGLDRLVDVLEAEAAGRASRSIERVTVGELVAACATNGRPSTGKSDPGTPDAKEAAMRIANDITRLIGNTPLVRLNRMAKDRPRARSSPPSWSTSTRRTR